MGACLALAAAARSAEAGVVADYQDDFSYPAASVGWTYLWNANGAIGTATNYVSLVPDGASPARYETQNQTPDAFPDAAPGASASATSTTLVPGQGTAQNALERYVIAAYTISAADIAANGNQLILDGYSFAVSAGSADGITARVYKNNTLLVDQPLPPGLVFSVDTPAPNGGPIPLGPFVAGDTLYVAIGSNGVAPLPPFGPGGTDIGDVLTVDYSIVLVPEPASVGIVALGALGVLSRRRRV
ncbi:MAG: PEP-CTERM sorting domain-containing protein [Tepidisphaeraceae bacterium]